MFRRCTQLRLNTTILNSPTLYSGLSTVKSNYNYQLNGLPISFKNYICKFSSQSQLKYGGFSMTSVAYSQEPQLELFSNENNKQTEARVVGDSEDSTTTHLFNSDSDINSSETFSSEEAEFRREVFQHYEFFTSCIEFKPEVSQDISNLACTLELDSLIQSGDINASCDKFIYMLKNYHELQISSEHIVLLLQHLLKYQINLTSTNENFCQPENIFQILLEKGLLSNNIYSDLKIKNIIIAALDILVQSPYAFSHWNNFNLSTKKWIVYTFLFRPQHTTESIFSNFLSEVSPDYQYEAYKLVLSSICDFPNLNISIPLNLKLIKEMIVKEMDVDSHICYATISKILKTQQLTHVHFDSVWEIIKNTNNLDEHFLSYAYQNMINFLNTEINDVKDKDLRYLLLEVFNSMIQRRIVQPVSCYNMVLKHLVYLSHESSNDASTLAHNPIYEISETTPLDSSLQLPDLNSWYYTQMKKIFEHMIFMKIQLDSYTLNAFLLYFIFSHRPRQPISNNTLECCYQTLVLAGANPDQLTFNYLIKFYGKSGDTTSMKNVIAGMISHKLYPNSQTLEGLIAVLTEKQDFQSALQFFDKMTTKSEYNNYGELAPITPSVETCVAMFSVCQKYRDIALLDRLWSICKHHQEYNSHKLVQNTYHQVILAYSRLLHTPGMGSHNYPVDPNLVLERIQSIVYLLNIDYPEHVQLSIYNVLLKGYTLYLVTPQGRENWMSSYDLIRQVLIKMINSTHSKPNLISYNTILSSLPLILKSTAQVNYFQTEVMHLQESMDKLNISPDAYMTTSLMKIFGIFGRGDLVEKAFHDFLQSQKTVNFSPSRLLALYNFYLQCHKSTDPLFYSKVLDFMKDQNINPSKETFCTIFNKWNRFQNASFDLLTNILHKTSYLTGDSRIVDFQFLCSLGDSFSIFGGQGLLYSYDFVFQNLDCSHFRPKEYSLIIILLLKPSKTDLRLIPQTLNMVKNCLVKIQSFPTSLVDPLIYKKLIESLEFSYRSHQPHWQQIPDLINALEDLKRRSTSS